MANHPDSTSSNFIYDYEVFISFRGATTRYGFTGHLYNALSKNGIITFIDNEELRSGAEIRPTLLEAIEKSRMSIVVLCERYASSTWCLEELVKIIDCYDNKGQQVLIIFYKVEPSDVLLNQNNSFEAALVKHEQRLGKDSDKVKGWRSALSRVCALPDKEHCRKNMYESELIKKIVKDTFAKLPPVQSQTKPIGGLGSRFVIDYIYDVFLSFSNGTRYTFSDYLYDALSKKRIHTFRGDKGLIEISPDILEAIEKSRMSIIVLCENYASSARCLDELSKIVECFDNEGQHVSAIFYKAEPTNVRFQKETYEAAMNEHENRYGKGSEKVKAWRFALSRVCDISGQHLRDNAYEFKLIKKIVRDTFVKVSSGPSENKYKVGLDSCFEQVKPLIDIENVRVVGIYGAAGTGKTTFTANLYDRIKHQFEDSCFLADIRERSKYEGLEDLQKKLLSEMGVETQAMEGGTFKGDFEIKRRLGRKRVLLVLDDVDSVEQLKSLAGKCDWFGSGSRIIITTRNPSVLDEHAVEIKKFKMEELNYDNSLKLFCYHAFNMSEPADDFDDICKRILGK